MAEFFASNSLEFWEILFRLVLATGLGFLVGLDRSIKNKPLGFRPFMLVSMGSCLFGMIVVEVGTAANLADGIAKVDVSRVMQGVIGGIGFLGAGAIIQSQANGHVIGSATGAGIWVVGGIGLAVGFGLYIYGFLAAVVAIIVFVVFGLLREEVDAETEALDGKR